MKFPLGQIVATPGALKAFAENDDTPAIYLVRHFQGDWGDIPPEDVRANEEAISYGLRVLSAYVLKDGTRVWIITESDRSSTCVLLPAEY